jgi:uncharacterized protein (TIGR02284 family)
VQACGTFDPIERSAASDARLAKAKRKNAAKIKLEEISMTDHIDHMKSLHTTVVDARNGYEEALKDAEGRGLTPLFRDMIALHQSHADALAADLIRHGQKVDDKGSFLSTVHRTVISIRALFGGLDDSILPGLIDGEERVVSYYDEALAECPPAETTTLAKQRAALQEKITQMKAQKSVAA